jgi:Holliday junction resolvase RusA-like endonuclease
MAKRGYLVQTGLFGDSEPLEGIGGGKGAAKARKTTREGVFWPFDPIPWVPVLDLWLEGVPVAKARPKAVRRGAGIGMYQPKATERAQKELERQIRAKRWDRPLGGAVRVEVVVVLDCPKSAKGRAYPVVKPDIDNFAKMILDAMTGAGIWDDDNQVIDLSVSKRYGQGLPGWSVKVFLAPE